MNEFSIETLIAFIKIAVVFGFVLSNVAIMVYVERRVIAFMQQRPGPNRVGPFGLLQTSADALKIFFKEDVFPADVDRPLYHIGPILTLLPALLVGCLIPWGPVIEVGGRLIALTVADIDLGLLFFFAIASFTVYGLVISGWSSNNKWSLLGGMRSAAQMISYEVSLALSVVGLLLIAQTFNFREIADQQQGGFWNWHIFKQPLGFLLFFIAGTAELNRTPFDLPEGESELTGGFHTEYSSMRFAFFFMAEYSNVFLFSAILATLFFGGYHLPFAYEYAAAGRGATILEGILGFGVLAIKTGAFVFLFVWIRATLPRLRFDQLMNFGWKVMLPLAFVNLFLTAGLVAFDAPVWLMFVVGVAAFILSDLLLSTILRRQRRRDFDQFVERVQRNV